MGIRGLVSGNWVGGGDRAMEWEFGWGVGIGLGGGNRIEEWEYDWGVVLRLGGGGGGE